MILVGLLVLAMALEAWTMVFTTEHNIGGVTFCDLNPSLVPRHVFPWLILGEAVLSYFLPFVLILTADISVFTRSYAAGIFTQLTRADLDKQNSHPDAAKILPPHYQRNYMRRKQRNILRCILAASLDLTLNLPEYSLQLLDNFIPLARLFGDYRLHYGLEAFAYVLYFCQFPLIVVYVRWILRDFGVRFRNGTRLSSTGEMYMSHMGNSLEVPLVTQTTSVNGLPMRRPTLSFDHTMTRPRANSVSAQPITSLPITLETTKTTTTKTTFKL